MFVDVIVDGQVEEVYCVEVLVDVIYCIVVGIGLGVVVVYVCYQ